MKTDRNILIAFLLNLLFSIAELMGGIFTGSIAIISDALHDFGDATAIAISYVLERLSKRPPDKTHTYGYCRYSVLGGALNALILLIGSVLVGYGAIQRLFNPTPIHYDGMIIMAIFGVIVNLLAAYATHGHGSINQRAVNLHMLEDVLGWIVVLIGAVTMRFTGWWIIDPILSMAVALFILVNAWKTLRQVLDILLEKAPGNVSKNAVEDCLQNINGVMSLHHIHIWALDDQTVCATLVVVCKHNESAVKEEIRHKLHHLGIQHCTIETVSSSDFVLECNLHHRHSHHCHHHHHH